jgi:hypothetical protein
MKRLLVLTATIGMFACSQAALETPPADFKWNDWQKTYPPKEAAKRMALIQPVKAGELRLTPTYVSCSVCWGVAEPVEGIALEYRKAGGGWKRGETPLYFRDAENYRGSMFYLDEDTAYEMRLTAGGKTLASGNFRTWKTDVPVAKTVIIDPATAKYPIVISAKGRPDGWIRYTAKPGTIVGGKDIMTSVIKVTGAEYVMLEDMTIEGGGGIPSNSVFIEKSTGVRVRNCELYGFGRLGETQFNAKGAGKPGHVDAKGNVRTYNWDAGIMIYPGSAEVTVERCYIHDARGRSNSWYYSHPSGTEGIFVYRVAHSIVLRWNDIVGSDLHRWNDAIEGCDNFGEGGGFNRDSDIYGNFCIYANDDCIELDGGQQNVRCFQNRFEAAISDISIQGCMVSPVYVFDNLLAPCCDEFGYVNPCIKTSTFNPYWFEPYAGIWGNWFGEKAFNPSLGYKARMDLRADNIYSTGEIPREWATKYPVRDIPFILDRGVIRGVEANGGAASPASVTFTAEATAEQPFRIRQNFDADWFTVEPQAGVMKKGVNRFKVTFLPEKMRDRRFWRSAFLVQTPEGLSRCMSIYAERMDFAPPVKPVPEGPRTVYSLESAPITMNGGKGQVREFAFDLKEDGEYWLFVRAKGTSKFPRASVSLDGAAPASTTLCLWPTHEVWNMLMLGKKGRLGGGKIVAGHKLKAGRHTLKFYGTRGSQFEFTGLAVSDKPLAFEPR